MELKHFGALDIFSRGGKWYICRRSNGEIIEKLPSKWEAVKRAKHLTTQKRAAGWKGTANGQLQHKLASE